MDDEKKWKFKLAVLGAAIFTPSILAVLPAVPKNIPREPKRAFF